MEMHVHCFCLSQLDVIIDEVKCRAVVSLYRRWGLLVSHFFKCMLLGDGIAGIDIQRTEFGFGGGGHDGLDDLGKVEECAIVFGVGSVGGQENSLPVRLRALGLLR
jgi:hypothetical protein